MRHLTNLVGLALVSFAIYTPGVADGRDMGGDSGSSSDFRGFALDYSGLPRPEAVAAAKTVATVIRRALDHYTKGSHPYRGLEWLLDPELASDKDPANPAYRPTIALDARTFPALGLDKATEQGLGGSAILSPVVKPPPSLTGSDATEKAGLWVLRLHKMEMDFVLAQALPGGVLSTRGAGAAKPPDDPVGFLTDLYGVDLETVRRVVASADWIRDVAVHPERLPLPPKGRATGVNDDPRHSPRLRQQEAQAYALVWASFLDQTPVPEPFYALLAEMARGTPGLFTGGESLLELPRLLAPPGQWKALLARWDRALAGDGNRLFPEVFTRLRNQNASRALLGWVYEPPAGAR